MKTKTMKAMKTMKAKRRKCTKEGHRRWAFWQVNDKQIDMLIAFAKKMMGRIKTKTPLRMPSTHHLKSYCNAHSMAFAPSRHALRCLLDMNYKGYQTNALAKKNETAKQSVLPASLVAKMSRRSTVVHASPQKYRQKTLTGGIVKSSKADKKEPSSPPKVKKEPSSPPKVKKERSSPPKVKKEMFSPPKVQKVQSI